MYEKKRERTAVVVEQLNFIYSSQKKKNKFKICVFVPAKSNFAHSNNFALTKVVTVKESWRKIQCCINESHSNNIKKTFFYFYFFLFLIIKCFHNFFDFILFLCFEKMKTGFFCVPSMPTTRSHFYLFSSLSLALTVTHKKRANSFANKLIINASVNTFFLSFLSSSQIKKKVVDKVALRNQFFSIFFRLLRGSYAFVTSNV